MSTKLTKSPRAGFDLLDSHALALTMATGGFQDRMIAWLLGRLNAEGFTPLSASQLSFLGALDCGPNHAAELARKLGVSRQAVHKTVRELESAGWLETGPDKEFGNQRVIRFTREGERMMAVARRLFAELDESLVATFGERGLRSLKRFLAFDPAAPVL